MIYNDIKGEVDCQALEKKKRGRNKKFKIGFIIFSKLNLFDQFMPIFETPL